MLIPGSELGATDSICYYGVFRNPNPSGHWVFGTKVMQDYYVTFDGSTAQLKTWFGRRSNQLKIDANAVPDDAGDDPFKYLVIGLVAAALLLIGGILFFLKIRAKSNQSGFASNSRQNLVDNYN